MTWSQAKFRNADIEEELLIKSYNFDMKNKY